MAVAAAAFAEAVAAAVEVAWAELPYALPPAVLQTFDQILALSCGAAAAGEWGPVGVETEEPRAACKRPLNVDRPVSALEGMQFHDSPYAPCMRSNMHCRSVPQVACNLTAALCNLYLGETTFMRMVLTCGQAGCPGWCLAMAIHCLCSSFES